MSTRRAVLLILASALLTLAGCEGFFTSEKGDGGGGGGTGVAPRLAYVANAAQDLTPGSISPFAVDPNSGNLTAFASGAVPVNGSPNSLAVDKNVTVLYVAGRAGGVSGFQINSDGSLLAVAGSPFVAGMDPFAVAIDPSTRFLYVANKLSANISIFTIGTGGILTSVGTIIAGLNPVGLAIDKNAVNLYAASSSAGTYVYKINQNDGTLTRVDIVVPHSGVSSAVAVDPIGQFVYVANGAAPGAIDAYARNASTGDLTLTSAASFPTGGTNPTAIAIDPTGTHLYATNQDSNTVAAFTINADGSLTKVTGSPFVTGQMPTSATVDPSGKFLYLTNFNSATVSVYNIGPDGALTSRRDAQLPTNAAAVVVTR